MSVVSDSYDAIVAKVASELPTRLRLWNQYKPFEGSEKTISKGYSVGFSIGENTNRVAGCDVTFSRLIIITLTEKAFAVDADVTKKTDAEKALLEDAFTIFKAFENDASLGVAGVDNFQYQSDTGIEFVFDDKDNYIMNQMTYLLEYKDSLI